MSSYIGRLFILVFSCIFVINRLQCADISNLEQSPYNVLKVNNNFYVGQMRSDDKKLWLVMERIDERTLPLWQTYIGVQSNPRINVLVNGMDQKGSLLDGSGHFFNVLYETSSTLNEMWVAYITRAETPEPIPDSMKSYSATDLDAFMQRKGREFTKNILMFVTVTSSPRALITSHMGIARSVEGVFSSVRHVSLDLHSFAAKVMLLHNPERKYMVNAPVAAVEKIIREALPPQSVFVGTREVRKMIQERLDMSLEQFKSEHQDTVSEIVKTHKGNAKFIKILINQEFFLFKAPYSHASFKFDPQPEYTTTVAREFLDYLHRYPPLLSDDEVRMTIYDKDNPESPWLSIDKTNCDYNWIFTQPFVPTGQTHYIVVDLVNLAKCRPLEPMAASMMSSLGIHF